MMKEQLDSKTNVTPEAVLAIAKSTELFIAYLTKSALELSEKEKRKTVAYKDIGNLIVALAHGFTAAVNAKIVIQRTAVVSSRDSLVFLEDLIPSKMAFIQAKKLAEDVSAQRLAYGDDPDA
ncbi:hypothetical protein SARC_03425 [Sphaeroforma arctica JP610]|uniref:Transcription factor CBF/NF-Y/archaeal histone domain-containing protein n=1 Tax=Sphaeroforma arctica JP610 TaxID=667725 RepID=A0A0L0G5P6_9EUKA|nr:hypothetical protein SARC_03425 [Sphaeroforma arctica JP610]KNC84345.1 hypothetical protein SARC_03425 [Sphaeroforma arctica JP610]|eukprot:XP_014158247.1 hypothetical protein SARC_03425 [Sphaeroforma arctica JP610]